MKTSTSMQTSILSTVTLSLLILAAFLVFGISTNEVNKNQDNIKQLVLEQVALIVKKLDNYSVIGQVDAISKTVFDLERVEALVMYDGNCNEIRRQPLNFRLKWDCNSFIHQNDVIKYEVKNTFSNSEGAPRFILAKVAFDQYSIFTLNNLALLIVTLSSILATIVILNSLMRKKILVPLKNLRNLIGQAGSLSEESLHNVELPIELAPIFESVVRRDEVIQQAKTELLAQSKSQAIAEISQQVAHDIKFPIMVLRDKLMNSKSDSDFKYYEQSLKDLEEITGQLLDRSEESHQDLNLADLVQSVVERKQIEFKAISHRLKIEFANKSLSSKIHGNPSKLKSVVSNLINNSKEAIGFKPNGEIEISVEERADSVCLIFKDNGCGIKPKDISEIFKRGVSIRKPGGTGLGLSNAKDVVERLNGTIAIQSDGKGGTSIEINLPKVKSNFQSTGCAPFDNVLIEDYKLSQMLWLETAKEKNLNFIVFSSPNDFLKNQNIVSTDARIFVDSQFPDFDGCGVVWSKSLLDIGFKNVWACSTSEFDVGNMPWLSGYVKKTIPFNI